MANLLEICKFFTIPGLIIATKRRVIMNNIHFMKEGLGKLGKKLLSKLIRPITDVYQAHCLNKDPVTFIARMAEQTNGGPLNGGYKIERLLDDSSGRMREHIMVTWPNGLASGIDRDVTPRGTPTGPWIGYYNDAKAGISGEPINMTHPGAFEKLKDAFKIRLKQPAIEMGH